MEGKSKRAGNCSRRIRMEHWIQVEERRERSFRAWETVGRKFVVIEWVKHQVVSSVKDLILF